MVLKGFHKRLIEFLSPQTSKKTFKFEMGESTKVVMSYEAIFLEQYQNQATHHNRTAQLSVTGQYLVALAVQGLIDKF